MKRSRVFYHSLVLGLLAAGLTSASPAQAGRRHHGNCAPACEPTAPCGTAVATPQVVTRTIMVPQVSYKMVTVPVTVCKPVARTKTITVYRDLPETKEVRRMVTVMVPQTKTRTEHYQVRTPEWKDVTRNVTVMVPTPVTKTGVRTYCKPVLETQMRTVCRDCGHFECSTCVDACGRCQTQRVWVQNVVRQEIPVTVCRTEMVQEPYSCTVMVCKPVMQTKTERVCTMKVETKTREVPYTVCVARQEEKVCHVTVCKRVAEDKVIHYTEMVRTVENQQRQVCVTTMVPKVVTCVVGCCN